MWRDDGSDFATIDDELSALAAAVVRDPEVQRGAWHKLRGDTHPFDRVFVDFGSGMGDFAVELARLHPNALVVGVEKELFCVAKSARKALAAAQTNCVFVPAEPSSLDELFAVGEVYAIFLNFPTPYPRARDAERRMVHAVQFAAYRRILAPGGFVRLKTDSQPLRDFALTQLAVAGYELHEHAHIELPSTPAGYEVRLVELGAPVFEVVAVPAGTPALSEDTAPMSLYDYLPEDLESMTYVPKDMQRSVQAALEAKARVESGRKARS